MALGMTEIMHLSGVWIYPKLGSKCVIYIPKLNQSLCIVKAHNSVNCRLV